MIRIVVVDDQSLVRAGFVALLSAEDDMEVLGEGADGATAVSLATRLRPDVMLMDIRMPGMNGIEATRRIAADPDLADVRVVILTTFDLDDYVFEALRAGATGFLLKDTDAADLIAAVRVAAAGEALLSPDLTRRLIAEFNGVGTDYVVTVDPRTGAVHRVGKPTGGTAGHGVSGTALSRDGAAILGVQDAITAIPSVVTLPYQGGRPRVLARNAISPSWSR